MVGLRILLAGLLVAAAMAAGFPARAGDTEPHQYIVTIDANGPGIDAPIGGKTGDPVRGRAIAVASTGGNCLACHAMPVSEHDFHGEVGPSLWGVAGRLSVREIRLQMVEPWRFNPESIMPSFYRNDGLNLVREDVAGKTILTAGEVEDVIAYIATLDKDEE